MLSPPSADALKMRAPGKEHWGPGSGLQDRGAGPWRGPLVRDGLVKERLSSLLESLGELPAGFPPDVSALATPSPEPLQGLGRVLSEICPAGTVLIHNRRLKGCALGLEHLVVAPRGVVVVSPEWAPVKVRFPTAPAPMLSGAAANSAALLAQNEGASNCASMAHPSLFSSTFLFSGTLPGAPPGAGTGGGQASGRRRRSAVVRAALRRAHALRSWLENAPWAGTPVLAAVCCLPMIGAPPLAPVLIDGLWLGPIERLAPWLAGGADLSPTARVALGQYLAAALD